MANSGDVGFTLAGWLVAGSALEVELQRLPVSSDMGATALDPLPEGLLMFSWYTSPGDSQSMTWTLAAGTYLLDCVTEIHVWRPAQLNVVAP